MKKQFFFCTFLPLLFLGSLFTGCISLQLPGSKNQRAKNVQTLDPVKPFKKIKADNADQTWISSNTGNTISFLSECGNANDTSLQIIESESLGAISNLSRNKTQELNYNGRQAQQTEATGEVDGVKVKIVLLVFKKNGCSYLISYGGVEKDFDQELSHFETFKENFKAP